MAVAIFSKNKIMLLYGIISIFAAFVFYTFAIMREQLTKKITKLILIVFTMGFLSDLIGTSIMFYIAEDRFSANIHSICGYFALIIMFLHLSWAILSFRMPKYEKYFTRGSLLAWFIWVLAFISGIPS